MVHDIAKGKYRLKNKLTYLWPGPLRVTPLLPCWTDTKQEAVLPLHCCTRCPRKKATYGIFLLPATCFLEVNPAESYLRWDFQPVGTLEAADLIHRFLKSLGCFLSSSVMLPSRYNTEERRWLRKSSKSSYSCGIISTALTPWMYCTQEICCADYVDGYNPWYFFILNFCLFLFLLRRVSKYLFLESLRSFQDLCIGVCVYRLAMLPQYHLRDILHDGILPSFPNVASPYHQKTHHQQHPPEERHFLPCTTIVILKTMALRQNSPEGYLVNKLRTITN